MQFDSDSVKFLYAAFYPYMVSRQEISPAEMRTILNFFQPQGQQINKELIKELCARIDSELFYTEIERAKFNELKETLFENIDDSIKLIQKAINEALTELRKISKAEMEKRLEVALSITSAVGEKDFELNLLSTMVKLINEQDRNVISAERLKAHFRFSCMALGYDPDLIWKNYAIS